MKDFLRRLPIAVVIAIGKMNGCVTAGFDPSVLQSRDGDFFRYVE